MRTGRTETRERLAWFKWFPGDWLAETQDWPLLARGVYRELLDAQWNMGALPAEPSRLRKLVHATPREWRVAWPLVSLKFPTVPGGRLHPGLEERRRQAYAQRDRHRAGARHTNAVRWGDRSPIAHRSLSESLSESHPSSSTTKREETPQRETGLGDAAVVVDPRGARR